MAISFSRFGRATGPLSRTTVAGAPRTALSVERHRHQESWGVRRAGLLDQRIAGQAESAGQRPFL